MSGWGVAFSGGGQRGFAHIGVIRALEERGVVPKAVAGTSAGAIFGSFWSAGLKAQEMAGWASKLNTRRLLDFYFSLPKFLFSAYQVARGSLFNLALPPAVFRGEKIYKALRGFLGDMTMAEVKIPLVIPAVDLDTGEEVLFCSNQQAETLYDTHIMPRSIPLADAIRASISIPGVFAPWQVAGRRLVDGGLSDNLPLRRLKPLGADRLIAVDVGEPIPYAASASTGLPGILERSVAILARQLVSCRMEKAEIVIAPSLPPVMIGDFRQNHILVARGYAGALEALDRWFNSR